MYCFSELMLSKIGKEKADVVKVFFEDAVNGLNLPNVNEEKEKIMMDMCEAFWEDVCITTELKTIFHSTENPQAVQDEGELELLYDENGSMKYNLFINTENGCEIAEQNCLLLKKRVSSDLWKSLLPCFLYIAADADLYGNGRFDLEDLETYSFIYSLGLLFESDSDYEGKTITEVLLEELKKKYHMEKSREDVKPEKEEKLTWKGEKNMEGTMFYTAMDVKKMLGISRGKAYQIIKNLNDELEREGYITISGKIPKKLFAEKIYGMAR